MRDLPDPRDLRFSIKIDVVKNLPESVDLRPRCPPVYDQKHLNSCTANAVAAAVEFDLMKQNRHEFVPSRLFLYYNERAMRNVQCADCGSTPREGIKAVATKGDCPEEIWPYKPRSFAVKPLRICYIKARKYKAVRYWRLKRDLDHLRACLASGYPFVFGFTVHESFDSGDVWKTGRLELPRRGEKATGGHAVVAVGYNDSSGRFIVRNSFGSGWGLKGYFTMPYEYLLKENLSADFWTIRVVS